MSTAGQAPTGSRPRLAPATKAARQARIAAILAREQVHSQEQLAGLLSQYGGLHVTQATLSRDLDELGVVRLRAADGTLVYALPGDPGGYASPPGNAIDYPERRRALPGPSPSGGGQDRPRRQATGGAPPALRSAAPGAGDGLRSGPPRPTRSPGPGPAPAPDGPPRLVPGATPAPPRPGWPGT